MDCDCAKCRRAESPKDEAGNAVVVGDEVEFLEPYQGFTAGTVVELCRGVKGPVAGVRLMGRARVVDLPCRQLRRVNAEIE
ncbi:MAG: hypothetical protein K8U57_04470 [Planctomycetes bacterium]|nr:hypothetical protein [Planctomycetota bacterium]